VGGPGTDPIQDAFLRASRPVSELYSEALADLDVDGYRSTLRLTCRTTDENAVRVSVMSSKIGFVDELGSIALPRAVGRLDARGRARLALEAIHAAVLVLADCRSWDAAQFQRCYDHVVANDFEFRWNGVWKSSPDRRHQARATYRLAADDGFGRVRLSVRETRSGDVVASSDEAVAFCTSKGFGRSARTLRWVGSDHVELTPYVGLLGERSGALAARRGPDGWSITLRDDVVVRRPEGGADAAPSTGLPAVVATSHTAP